MKQNLITKVLSLGIGLALGIVLIAKVFFELSYDSFYKDIDRVYSIWTGYTQNSDSHDFGQVSGATALGFRAEVPGVEAATRTTFIFNDNNYVDENNNKITGVLVAADSCFFDVFDRPILAGNPKDALSKNGCVMVSRSFAEKLLTSNNESVRDVLGKQIYNEDVPNVKLTIEGVYEDFPKNGSLYYDILLSMVSYRKESYENWIGNDRYKGYVKLADGVDPHSLKDAIRKMQEAHQPLAQFEQNGISLWYYLKPYSSIHTSDPEVHSQIVMLSIVAALLILISLLNYILIVISTIVKRSKEVGIRKCYGAEARNIYALLSREAGLHVFLSLLVAAIIIGICRSEVENLLGVPFSTLLVPQSVVAIVGVVVLILVVSIVVPAQLYTRIPIYVALKSYTENSRRWKLGLVGTQVFINVFLAIMMIIVGTQYEKVSHSNTGYNYENLYYFSTYNGDRVAQQRAISTLRSLPEVSGVATAYNIPYQGSNGDNVYLPSAPEKELFNFADQYDCSENFCELLDIEYVTGRAPRDSSEVAVDEEFVKKMSQFADWSDGAVGKQILVTGHKPTVGTAFMDLASYTISGVYKSYLIGNLINVDRRPSALFYGNIENPNSYMPHTFFKVKNNDAPTMNKIRTALAEMSDGKEVNIISYEEEMRNIYSDSLKMRNTIAVGGIFSILIAALGLFGFIRDEAQRRSKEIAVRKINGASTRDITALFVWGIMKFSVIMAALAAVVTLFAAQKWLEQFADKISLNPLYFIGGTLAVLALVAGIVMLCCLRIARANPVDSLKNE